MMRYSPLYGASRGFLTRTGPEGTKEGETFTCQHCNFVTYVKPFADPAEVGGFCPGCSKLICKGCVGAMRCDPIEAKLERAERRGEALRSYGF